MHCPQATLLERVVKRAGVRGATFNGKARWEFQLQLGSAQSIIWRNFRIEIPADWEMLLFSKDPKSGHCTFADRYQHRLQMNWARLTGRPDMARMVDDYLGRIKEEDPAAAAGKLKIGGWQGLKSRTSDTNTSRLGRYFDRESCLIELVFLWPVARDAGLERGILDSVDEAPVRKDGLQRWRAFGMDILASKELSLAKCTVQPAKTTMVFQNDAKSPIEERFERIGMLDEWMQVSVEQWLNKSAARQAQRVRADSGQVSGHQLWSVTGERRQQGLRNPLKRKPVYSARAWICPNDGRLYHFEVTSAASADASETARLSCCSDLGHRQ